MVEGEGETERMSGAEKVDTKDGTAKFGLPCEDATGLAQLTFSKSLFVTKAMNKKLLSEI